MYRFYIPLICLISNFYLNASQSKQTLVMINPAGHATNTGRKLVEDYERSQTLKFAESLSLELQKKYRTRCILTRYPGEEIVDLQNASFANRLSVDFYLSLHIYRETFVKPKLFLYNLIYNPIADLAPRNFELYSFVSIYESHFLNINTTKSFGEKMKKVLTSKACKRRFDFHGIFGLPLRPLCGIIAPAIMIEVGICRDNQWKDILEYIVESLYFLKKQSNF